MIDIMLLSCGSEKKKIPAETFLSAYRPGHTYTVTRGAYGKPLLYGTPALCLSKSDSGSYAACAFSESDVGLDLQQMSDGPLLMKIAGRFFTAEESGLLQSLTGADRIHVFYRLWTIKEAYIKLTGLGLSQGLDAFLVSGTQEMALSPRARGRGRILLPENPDRTAAYYEELPGPDGYRMAVCSFQPVDGCIVLDDSP